MLHYREFGTIKLFIIGNLAINIVILTYFRPSRLLRNLPVMQGELGTCIIPCIITSVDSSVD